MILTPRAASCVFKSPSARVAAAVQVVLHESLGVVAGFVKKCETGPEMHRNKKAVNEEAVLARSVHR